MPLEGSSGVEATFHTSTRPVSSSNRQTSVNVPPESTPTRQAIVQKTPLIGASIFWRPKHGYSPRYRPAAHGNRSLRCHHSVATLAETGGRGKWRLTYRLSS